MSPHAQSIHEALLADGWRTFPSPFRDDDKINYAKSFDYHAECKCNRGKRKQAEVYFRQSKWINEHRCPESWRVDMVGQLPDNEWLLMNVEGLNDLPTILRTVDQLLKTWDYAVSITPTIADPDEN